jgi:rsbT co-antagonist protein RsbR
MLKWAEASRLPLEQATLKVLREHVTDNGSALPPFRLPALAKQVVGALLQFLRVADSAAALAFGERLGTQGLGLRSWLAVGRALTDAFVARACDSGGAPGESADAATVLSRLHAFASQVVEGLARHDLAALSHERDEIHKALERAIQTREDELRQVIEELSTPVMPVHRQILVLPLIGGVNDERARKITERVLDETTRRKARIVIIDVTGLSTSDAAAVAALTGTARAVQLLGARAVLVGIPPEMAHHLSELAIDLSRIPVLTNLQSGVEWALQQLGLAIAPRRAAPAGGRVDERSIHHGD